MVNNMICSVNGCSNEAIIRFRPLGDIPLCEVHKNEFCEVREKTYSKHNIFKLKNTKD